MSRFIGYPHQDDLLPLARHLGVTVHDVGIAEHWNELDPQARPPGDRGVRHPLRHDWPRGLRSLRPCAAPPLARIRRPSPHRPTGLRLAPGTRAPAVQPEAVLGHRGRTAADPATVGIGTRRVRRHPHEPAHANFLHRRREHVHRSCLLGRVKLRQLRPAAEESHPGRRLWRRRSQNGRSACGCPHR